MYLCKELKKKNNLIFIVMIVETKNKETIIKIPNTIDFTYLQDFLDYITVKSIVSKSKATDKQVNDIAEKAQANWWKKNKSKFVK